MPALTQDRGGAFQIGPTHDQHRFPVAPGTVIYMGALVSFDASGELIPAADVSSQAGKAVYLSLEHSERQAGQGEVRCMCMTRGTLIADAAALSGVTAQQRGLPAHVVSDHEVATTSTNNRSFGRIVDVTAHGVAIEI